MTHTEIAPTEFVKPRRNAPLNTPATPLAAVLSMKVNGWRITSDGRTAVLRYAGVDLIVWQQNDSDDSTAVLWGNEEDHYSRGVDTVWLRQDGRDTTHYYAKNCAEAVRVAERTMRRKCRTWQNPDYGNAGTEPTIVVLTELRGERSRGVLNSAAQYPRS